MKDEDQELVPSIGNLNQPSKKLISIGDNLLLKLPSDQIRKINNLSPDTWISLGKFGRFQSNCLIGQPFGLTYQVLDDGNICLDEDDRQDEDFLILDEKNPLVDVILDEIDTIKLANRICNVEEIEATNEKIKENDPVQKLTNDQIEELKKSGMSGREIILKQIQQHSAFELKTEYSKAKYIKRKEKKFLKKFTCIDPTINNLCEYLFENQAHSIRGLRPDTLSQILSLSNVRPGWKGIVIDDIGGLLIGSVLIRMGGEGKVFLINDADSPPDLHFLELFNLNATALSPLRSLNWAQIESDWLKEEEEEILSTSQSHPSITTTATATISPLQPHLAPTSHPSATLSSNKPDRTQIKSKKKNQKLLDLFNLRKSFFGTQYEGLITCSQYEPGSILYKLIGNLGASSTIVIYSPHISPLTDLQNLLKKSITFATSSSSNSINPDDFRLLSKIKDSNSQFIHITISEPWIRRYQVLIGRTHPQMNGTHNGGFIFSAFKVLT